MFLNNNLIGSAYYNYSKNRNMNKYDNNSSNNSNNKKYYYTQHD